MYIRWSFTAPLLFLVASLSAFAQPLSLLPVPSKVEPGSGSMRVDAAFLVRQSGHTEARIDHAVNRLYERLALKLATPIPPVKLASQTPVVLEIQCAGPSAKVQQAQEDESYDLEVRANGATLKAANPLGVMHGLETFYQLVTIGADTYGAAPTIRIHDEPRFPWRGLLLDVSRHFMPVPLIERTIDGLAAVKMNVLHLHLSDDQAFRPAAEHAPELAEKGSRGQFYTKEELIALVDYAGERGVRIVPEFDMPGHTTAWMASHPELATVTTKTYEPSLRFGTEGTNEDVFDPTNPKLLKLIDRLVGDMTEIFPDEYFHIGGDEVVYTQWSNNPAITEFRKQHNLTDGKALQAWFNTELAKVLKKHHRRMVGWNEILHGEIPQDTVIQDWIGVEALQESVQRRFHVIISLGYYLDWMMPAWYHYGIDPLRPDPASADPLIAEADFEKFQQLRADQQKAVNLPAGSEKYVLGGEAAEWTELSGPWNVEAVLWPRLGAVAERFWSPADARDVQDLYRRFPALIAELSDLGIRVTDSLQAMRLRLAGNMEGARALDGFSETIEPVKYYTRNGSRRPENNALGPFNRLVDALPAESLAATNFHFLVRRYVGSRKPGDLAAIRRALLRWQADSEELQLLLPNNPRLQEAAPLSEYVKASITSALQAMEYLQRAERPPSEWETAQNSILDGIKAVAETRVAIVPSVRLLVQTAAR
jgi:hexosaminidase